MNARTNDSEPIPLDHDDVKWISVWQTSGETQTEMILDYLRQNGLHAIAYGDTSLGLITGTNCTVNVMVPEQEIETAIFLLHSSSDQDPAAEVDDSPENEQEGADSAAVSTTQKVLLGATAIAFNPLGAGIAYVASQTVSPYLDGLRQIECPICGLDLELAEDEVAKHEFVCPECRENISLDDIALCLQCHAETEISADDRSRGWYICHACQCAVPIELLPLLNDDS